MLTIQRLKQYHRGSNFLTSLPKYAKTSLMKKGSYMWTFSSLCPNLFRVKDRLESRLPVRSLGEGGRLHGSAALRRPAKRPRPSPLRRKRRRRVGQQKRAKNGDVSRKSGGRTEAVPSVPVGRTWQRRSEDGATEARDHAAVFDPK